MAEKKTRPSTDERSTPSGIPVAPVYRPADARVDYDRDLGDPGRFPFTRGVQSSMYRGRLWTMRQYAGFGTAAETNVRFRHLLDAGQTGLSVAFDLPTQMGIDSDSPRALGEVGRVGVAIDSVEDMHELLAGIPLDRVSTSMTINATAATLLAMYIVVAEERGVDRAQVSGTIQNDILKEYIARGTYIYPPRPSLALIAEIFRFCAAEVPNWNPISISGYHIREAGSTAVQELAFTFANAVEYVRRALASLPPNRSRIRRAQIRRAARNFATSSNRSLCAAKKNDSRGANASTPSPASTARFTYSTAFEKVNASSCTAVDPASRMW